MATNPNLRKVLDYGQNAVLGVVEMLIFTLVFTIICIYYYKRYTTTYRTSDERIMDFAQPLFNADPSNMLVPRCKPDSQPDPVNHPNTWCRTVCKAPQQNVTTTYHLTIGDGTGIAANNIYVDMTPSTVQQDASTTPVPSGISGLDSAESISCSPDTAPPYPASYNAVSLDTLPDGFNVDSVTACTYEISAVDLPSETCITSMNPLRNWDKCDSDSILHYSDGTVAVNYSCEPQGWVDGDTKDNVIAKYTLNTAPTGWEIMCAPNDYNCITL